MSLAVVCYSSYVTIAVMESAHGFFYAAPRKTLYPRHWKVPGAVLRSGCRQRLVRGDRYQAAETSRSVPCRSLGSLSIVLYKRPADHSSVNLRVDPLELDTEG
jgi:hypothetical protein